MFRYGVVQKYNRGELESQLMAILLVHNLTILSDHSLVRPRLLLEPNDTQERATLNHV